MTSTSEWPLNPEHITNDREDELPGQGVISRRNLEGELSAIAGRLRNPVTLLEFPSKGDQKLFHTAERAIQIEVRPACRGFRKATKGVHCNCVEDEFAELFRGAEESNIRSVFEENLAKNDSIREYGEIPNYSLELVENNGRYYLEFDCPLLGYRALAYPVVIEGRVLGVLYMGQLCLQDRLAFIESVMEGNRTRHPEEIEDALAAHGECVRGAERILKKEDYDLLILVGLEEVKDLEKILTEELNRHREAYISRKVAEYVRSLYDVLGKPKPQILLRNEGLERLWQIVERILENIRKDFKLEFIYLFGTNRIEMNPPQLLDIVAKAGEVPLDGLPVSLKKPIRFNLSKIPEKAMSTLMVSTQTPELREGIAGGYRLSRKDHFIRVVPATFSPSSMVVTWIGYKQLWNPIRDSRYRYSGQALDRAIRLFYTVVVTTHATILTATAKDNMERSLRVYRHELGQLTSGMDALRKTYMSSGQEMLNVTSRKADDICRDMEAYLGQIHHLSAKAGMTCEIPKPKKKHFQAFAQLLFKIKDTLYLDADQKNIQFSIHPCGPADPFRPPIFGDESLLEQLLFNLVNNAVKYCHPGTKIAMDCKKSDTRVSTQHILTVTNYGMEILAGTQPYELEFRGPNVGDTQGVGIGLYIADQIARAHGGGIQHRCEKVSRFNVPLMEAYLEAENIDKNESLIETIREQLGELRDSGKYSRVVALDENGDLRPTSVVPDELVAKIKEQTWEVTFEVTIPSF